MYVVVEGGGGVGRGGGGGRGDLHSKAFHGSDHFVFLLRQDQLFAWQKTQIHQQQQPGYELRSVNNASQSEVTLCAVFIFFSTSVLGYYVALNPA